MGLGNSTQIDVLELTRYTDNPFTPGSADRYVAAVGTSLKYWDGSSWTTLGSGGGGGATWESLYSADNTFNITGGTGFSIADTSASANATLTLTKDAGSSGAALVITQSGSGNDVTGTSGTWSVAKTGIGTFAGAIITGTASALSTSGAAVWTVLDNSATSLRIGPSGGPVFLTFDTTNSAEKLSTDALTFQVTSGLTELIQASNTISGLRVTNNTATTFGADANSAGVVVFRSTSLTTGALLQLQLTEGTLNGGFYLVARDVTGSANVFTVGEDGAHVIAGSAGNNVLTLTTGDAVLSDGSLTITDADNAATFSVTNNTATTASVIAFAGSGTFTGSTTTSFMTITPSGLTSGTAVFLVATALDSGIALDISTDSLTTGKVIDMSDLAAITTGKAIHIDATGTTQTSGILVHIDSASTGITGAGRLFLSDHTGATGTSAVLNEFASAATDETVVLRVTASAALAAGVLLDLSATALTTGTVLDLGGLDALTTGSALNVASNSSSTGTRNLVRILNDHASATGTTPLFIQNDAVTGTGSKFVQILAGAQSTKTVTIWLSIDGTTPNAALTGTAGDICLNGPSSVPYYCTGTTNWTALA